MSKIISIANQKGGVAKTTSTYNLAAAKAKAGKKVLMIDLDPQANLTAAAGIRPGSDDLEGMSTCFLFEKQKNEIVYDKSEAKEIGIKGLKDKLEQQIQDTENISNIYINTSETEEYIEVEVIYEVLESIGTKEKIEI